MKVLVIGNGGREHGWQPLNVASTSLLLTLVDHDTPVWLAPALLSFAQNEKIDLTIVGPEAPLVIGVVDAFRAAGLKIFGPTEGAAQLEGSKAFTKDFLARHKIPTADRKSVV